MPARRDDDEACSQSQNEASQARRPRSRCRPWQIGFLRERTNYSTNESHYLRRLNPNLFRWARFCCTSRWMSSFDNVPGFRRRPTFAVALTDFTSR